MRVDAEAPGEGFGIAQVAAGERKTLHRGERLEQREDLVHEREIVESDPVPLDELELRTMPAAELVIAENPGQLPDVAAAGGQQPLHRKLGRGLQIVPAAERRDVAGDARERRIGDGGGGERGRCDLDDATPAEKGPDRGDDARAAFKRRAQRVGAQWPGSGHSAPALIRPAP